MTDKEESIAMNFCRQLADFDRNIRRHAMNQLFKIAHPVSIPYLIESLSDEDTLVKTGAENTLIKIGEQSLPRLYDVFEHAKSETRLRAMSVYSNIGMSDNLELVVKLLHDPDISVKNLAIMRLEKNLNENASRALWDLCKNPTSSEFIRETSSTILSKQIVGIGDYLIEDLKSNDLDELATSTASKLFLTLKPEGDPYFHDSIDSKVADLKVLSLISLGKACLKHAEDLVRDESDIVRKQAVELIGKYGDKENLDLLFEIMNTPSLGVWKVSKMAIEAIENRS